MSSCIGKTRGGSGNREEKKKKKKKKKKKEKRKKKKGRTRVELWKMVLAVLLTLMMLAILGVVSGNRVYIYIYIEYMDFYFKIIKRNYWIL